MSLTEDEIRAQSGQFDLESVLHLDVSNGDYASISALEKCVNLKRLSIANNKISEFKPLAALTKLEYLDIRNNGLSTLRGIEELQSLQTFYAQGNAIGQLNELKALNGSPSLTAIFFQEKDGTLANPVCEHPSYFITVSQINNIVSIIDGEHLVLRSSAESVQLTGELSREELGIQPSRPWLGSEMERIRQQQEQRDRQGMMDKKSQAMVSKIKEEIKNTDDLDRRARLLLR